MWKPSNHPQYKNHNVKTIKFSKQFTKRNQNNEYQEEVEPRRLIWTTSLFLWVTEEKWFNLFYRVQLCITSQFLMKTSSWFLHGLQRNKLKIKETQFFRRQPLEALKLPLGKLSFGKLPLGKLHIWEVATWENTLGKLPLGKSPLGRPEST